jgi:cellulose synthase/poly-beta-1,6-N-acetylglucosamine synthase-like glycosyltransferase
LCRAVPNRQIHTAAARQFHHADAKGEALLDNVLASIARQNYPREKIEIILADAHSKVRTREIAKNTASPFSTTTAKTLRKANALLCIMPPASQPF